MYLVPLGDSDFDSLFRIFGVKDIIVISIFHNCAKCWHADVLVCFVLFFGRKESLFFGMRIKMNFLKRRISQNS